MVALGEVVSDVQVAGEDPAFAVDVEGVFFGDDDLGGVADGDGLQGGGLLVGAGDDLRHRVDARVEGAGPDLVADLDVFDGHWPVVGVDEGSGDEAVASFAGDAFGGPADS